MYAPPNAGLEKTNQYGYERRYGRDLKDPYRMDISSFSDPQRPHGVQQTQDFGAKERYPAQRYDKLGYQCESSGKLESFYPELTSPVSLQASNGVENYAYKDPNAFYQDRRSDTCGPVTGGDLPSPPAEFPNPMNTRFDAPTETYCAHGKERREPQYSQDKGSEIEPTSRYPSVYEHDVGKTFDGRGHYDSEESDVYPNTGLRRDNRRYGDQDDWRLASTHSPLRKPTCNMCGCKINNPSNTDVLHVKDDDNRGDAYFCSNCHKAIRSQLKTFINTPGQAARSTSQLAVSWAVGSWMAAKIITACLGKAHGR